MTGDNVSNPHPTPDGAKPIDWVEVMGIDGAKWAAEFRSTAIKLGYSDMDEGWLIGWFCNAIMAGFDEGARRALRGGE